MRGRRESKLPTWLAEGRAGARHASPEAIQADLAAGAPSNPDGTLNLIEYAAWLARENASGR